jgi:predicted Zn-dependent protease
MLSVTRLSVLLAAAALLSACQTVPLSGRSQLSLVSSGEMMAASYQQYDQMKRTYPMSKDTKAVERVQRIGKRIQKAVERYMADNNMSERLKGYEWEYNVIDGDVINAFCMPGGKVMVFTGIMKVAKDDEGLAVIMGHEIAHAVAEHGRERKSQAMLTSIGADILSAAVANKSAQSQNLWKAAFGLGAQVGFLLPYSREHESEADHMGLIFMAMAGYNPNAAVPFWERMAAQKGGKTSPEFLSTHPADGTRIEQIRQKLPEAMEYFNGSKRTPVT